MFLDGSLRIAGHVPDLIGALVSLIAALKLGPATITHALYIERVGELQQPVLRLRQRPKVSGRWPLETLSRFECG
jgi:hypothetical protein